MNIPLSFKTIIEKNQKLNGIVYYTVSQYDQILKENNLYFFEEYTDHGINHIESILNSSIKIIPNETIEQFLNNDSESIAIYILATILHDIGMHLTYDGFCALISGRNDDIRINEIDTKTWTELWNDFLDEARRFGDTEKKNIIGNETWNFRIPQLENKDKLNGEDKKLIGEFIRRNHPRIAHEIALKGFPIKNGYVPFASDLDYDLKNICGLIARSHGINIRSLFSYLELKFQDTWVKPYNIEIIYLMVLLRIADYFQIDSSRTPDVTVKLKTFNSPISEIEHYKHLDVKYVQTFNKDPETLILQCEPRNSYIFIKLQELFEDIQKELDTSWAILGEIYGKDVKEKQPKISYRRVKSNIDNVQNFAKKINYIPEKITFKVSNELPKLLIGPLYGNDPTFGVRELLQNAVDSCREREFIEKTEYKGEVNITLYSENDNYFFKIEDNGIGMSLNIVKNYFLEVGSSLRKSSLWKKTFSNEEGESKIQRSGKFGIGVLASFLIGNKLILETRDSNSEFGLTFSTDLNTEQIEITKTNKPSIGTIITIPIDKEILNKLKNSNYSFDKWYLQNTPQVNYIDKTGTFNKIGEVAKSPGYSDELNNSWKILNIENYNKIIWTFDKVFFDGSGKMISNGILIPEVRDFKKDYWEGKINRWIKELKLPFVSIFDFNGNLPLNLSRNNLDGGVIPFRKELQTEIYKDVLAKILTTEIKFPPNIKDFKIQKINHPAIGDFELLFSKRGFILKHNFFIKKNPDKTLLIFLRKKEFKFLSEFDIKDSFIFLSNEKRDFSMTDYQYQANVYSYYGAKLYTNKLMYDKLFDDYYNRYPVTVKKNHQIKNSSSENIELSYNYFNDEFILNELETNLSSCNAIIETKLNRINGSLNIDSSDIFEKLMLELLNNFDVIPYDMKERKEKYKSAFLELDYYIKKYE
ncbi:ATP-binding protein [Flavobacterium aquidurense]|uniref:Molecular chaperone HSP90 family-like protein n=1 Tax=Flavobacterium aquidurense TaxID=362413 RepID=A0A0Q0XNL2_9FLAO|nr:ATP-binding protein [Flavobacterium aquidurense]KQB37347.1 Molecular chaperone HSP90 family-like protein [Flavobacterium aquidurense]